MNISQFIESGLLQEVNRQILNPCGISLAIKRNSDGTLSFVDTILEHIPLDFNSFSIEDIIRYEKNMDNGRDMRIHKITAPPLEVVRVKSVEAVLSKLNDISGDLYISRILKSGLFTDEKRFIENIKYNWNDTCVYDAQHKIVLNISEFIGYDILKLI